MVKHVVKIDQIIISMFCCVVILILQVGKLSNY